MAVYLTPSERWPNSIDVVIENWGSGPALDVKWGLAATEAAKERFAQLFALDLFRGIPYFPPGEQLRSFAGTGPALLKDPVPPPIEVTVTYRGPTVRPRTETFILDVTRLANLAPYPVPEAEIADRLERLAVAVEDISKSLKQQAR
ncbi:MAG TPA: hypothetical protein VEZ44_11940 [bacterium]|nr:hypothetical protein [bacterium]